MLSLEFTFNWWNFIVILKLYVVLHEFHHAMGGLHEQQRDKRKYFVKINWENIDRANNDQFTLNAHTRNNQVYDYASILQYHLTVIYHHALYNVSSCSAI